MQTAAEGLLHECGFEIGQYKELSGEWRVARGSVGPGPNPWVCTFIVTGAYF